MPEGMWRACKFEEAYSMKGPEIRYMSELINKHARDGVQRFSHISRSVLAIHPKKHPEITIPSHWDYFTITAVSRGKELRVVLRGHSKSKAKQNDEITLLFRAGMSGNFHFKEAGVEFEKHAHLRFHFLDSEEAIYFVDPRRFGSWQISSEWGPVSERGPDLQNETDLAVKNIADNLKDKEFDRPICEVLLNQRFFNGIGNYLRAEILHRIDVSPFATARDVLAPAVVQPLARAGSFFGVLTTILDESLEILRKYGFGDDSDRIKNFEGWLQCYSKLSSCVDGIGRTIWFAPHHRPKQAKTRGGKARQGGKKKGTKRKGAREEGEEDDQEVEEKPKRKAIKVKSEEIEQPPAAPPATPSRTSRKRAAAGAATAATAVASKTSVVPKPAAKQSRKRVKMEPETEPDEARAVARGVPADTEAAVQRVSGRAATRTRRKTGVV